MTGIHDGSAAEDTLVCYEYDELSIRLWFRNHDVCEYTVDDVGKPALDEMKRFADSGRGLMRYIARSKAICNAKPRMWKEWLGRGNPGAGPG